MAAENARAVGGPTVKSVAIPAQHGGWSFVLEPVVIGILLAPTLAGLLLGTAALMIFLLDQPLRLALKDRRKGRRYARTRLAEQFALAYGLVGAVALTGAWLLAPNPFWPALAAAIPLALLQLGLDLRNQARSAAAEVAGALAFAAVAPALVLIAGWAPLAAFGLWAVLALRASSAILYVRARLRLEKGRPAHAAPALWAQGLLVAGLAALALLNLAPWLPLVGGLLLAGRALWGLSRWRKPMPAVQLGIREVIFGLIFAVCVVAGYAI
jgi:hypothetical protein